jgi:hypothetical protein
VPVDPFADDEAIPVLPTEPKSLKSGDVKYDQEQGTVEIHVNDASVVRSITHALGAVAEKHYRQQGS